MNSLVLTNSIGLSAAGLTTMAFIPQIIKIYKSKAADDVSYVTFLMFGFGVALWDLYGVQIHSVPVILANTITFILAISIVVMKLIFSRNRNDDDHI